MYLAAATCVVSYLIGSIPTGIIVGRLAHGIDIRSRGSGSSGATNALRVLGPRIAVVVAILDIAKGWAAAMLAARLHQQASASDAAWSVGLAGIAAVIGHIWPVYAGFRGGKGVAATAGVVLAIEPLAFVACIALFAVVAVSMRTASVASLAAILALPAVLLALSSPPAALAFSVIAAGLSLLTHRSNIRRLLAGDEQGF